MRYNTDAIGKGNGGNLANATSFYIHQRRFLHFFWNFTVFLKVPRETLILRLYFEAAVLQILVTSGFSKNSWWRYFLFDCFHL